MRNCRNIESHILCICFGEVLFAINLNRGLGAFKTVSGGSVK